MDTGKFTDKKFGHVRKGDVVLIAGDPPRASVVTAVGPKWITTDGVRCEPPQKYSVETGQSAGNWGGSLAGDRDNCIREILRRRLTSAFQKATYLPLGQRYPWTNEQIANALLALGQSPPTPEEVTAEVDRQIEKAKEGKIKI